MNKVDAIIQARTGSTRLPNKIIKKIGDKTVLEHVIERVKQTKRIDDIVIATTNEETDDIIVDYAKKNKVNYYRGSEEDVLARYYEAAKKFNSDTVVRITSDCPVIDPYIIDLLIEFYQKHNYDILTNAGPDVSQRTYPRGLDTEVFSYKALEKAYINASEKYQREHVTPYMYENFNNYVYKSDKDYSYHRWTLDTQEDFELIKKIFEHLYKGKHDFYLKDILNLFDNNPLLYEINQHISQKKIY